MDRAARRWETRGLEVLLDVSTEVLEHPDLKDADTGPEMFHYVRKEKIAESAVMGTFVIALCGETFPVTKVPKPGSPVCPQCKEIYESMAE
ncbi:DUF3039 domain-containing protein [Phytohabitans rumicis]|uniref:DUF3039 domain-containing protein n=1 Tax=Phytohabitans rumicis TaxID=1076125 RepID=UPI00156388C0|nr:DUF3039 domain-containing protein [Phytohabitans rumicis]